MLYARYAVATRPFPGEQENGDLAVVVTPDDPAKACGETMLFGLVDGAGHGPVAAKTAAAAGSELALHPLRSVADALTSLHRVLGGTRGAVAGLARVDLANNTVEYGGVGNIECRVLHQGHDSTRFISYNGLLGHTLPTPRTFNYSIAVGDMLVFHSDGVSGHWQPSRYPGLLLEAPAVVASLLLRDWGRYTDDATVLVVRFAEAEENVGA
jgi:stage II sporulation SpoE-like protein